jgi:hypothetical protein
MISKIGPDPVKSSELLELKDKRFIEQHSQAVLLEEKVTGRVWSFRNVTEYYRSDLLSRNRRWCAPNRWPKARLLDNENYWSANGRQGKRRKQQIEQKTNFWRPSVTNFEPLSMRY